LTQVLATFKKEANSFISQLMSAHAKGLLSNVTTGLSPGEYWRNSKVSSRKLAGVCGFDVSGMSFPFFLCTDYCYAELNS
jgi:hypothetical protein